MAIDAECETPIVKARGIEKGKKKALDCTRNAEIDRNNVGDVLCFDKTSSTIDPELVDRTKKIGEFSFERLGENATEVLKSSFKLTPRDICVRKHQPKLPESGEQRKIKTSKFLTKLLANTAAPLGELCRRYSLNKRQENGNEMTFFGREPGYSMNKKSHFVLHISFRGLFSTLRHSSTPPLCFCVFFNIPLLPESIPKFFASFSLLHKTS